MRVCTRRGRVNRICAPHNPRSTAGGRSPQWDEIETMKREMSVRLGSIPFRVACAWPSESVSESIDELIALGAQKVLVISSFPQFSRSTLGAGLDAVERAVATRPVAREIEWRLVADHMTDGWWIKSYAEAYQALWKSSRQSWLMDAATSLEAAVSSKQVAVLLSFHGLPVSFIRKGDPYQSRCEAFCAKLRDALGCDVQWCYQSRADSRDWLQPSLMTKIKVRRRVVPLLV